MRTVADVSAAAFNIPVYNSVYGGWVTVAGTSASAPLIAGVYGLAGNGATTTQKFLYAHASSLFDITSGTTTGSQAAREPPADSIPSASPAPATTPPPAWAPLTAPEPSTEAAGSAAGPRRLRTAARRAVSAGTSRLCSAVRTPRPGTG